MFALAELGFRSPFEQLIACILSIRTLDEVALPAALALFSRARTPPAIAALPVGSLDELIGETNFHERKASQIRVIAQRVVEEYGGELPCDLETMLSFTGVGIKCAHLAMGIACGEPLISVDIHVFRVTHRWGYIQAATPETATRALEAMLPPRYWIEINALLAPFGKHICTGTLPHCTSCPVLPMCRQIDVKQHR